MTSLRSPLLGISLSLSAATLLHAQSAPPVNADAILRDLNVIEQQQKQTVLSARQQLLNRLKSALMSNGAIGLYSDAVEAVEFEGKPNKAALYADWKSANSDLLRSKEMQTLTTMHLRYLVMSMERAMSDKPETFVAPSLAFANDLIASDAMFQQRPSAAKRDKPTDADRQAAAMAQKFSGAKRDLLDRSVGDGVISKWLRLSPYLPEKGDDWELTPGNLGGILEKNVRKAMRAQKNPQLIGTWDMEMQLLADRATAGRLDFAADQFNTVVRPKMLFSRANDMIVIGQRNQGILEIYALVKANPQHPDFGTWVARLRELLKPQEPAPAAAATPAAEGTSPQ